MQPLIKANNYGNPAAQPMVLVHGGPAAAGYMSTIAQSLKSDFYLIEPWQRPAGNTPLTVASHVQDMHNLLSSLNLAKPPIMLGHSWGAMLVLAYAAQYPSYCLGLLLVGCGTFDTESRKLLKGIIGQRLTPDKKALLEQLENAPLEQNEKLSRQGKIINQLYDYDCFEGAPASVDAAAHQQTWDNMLACQEQGLYPAVFTAIKAPVMMLHGEHDPHPGESIYRNLLKYMPQLKLHQWQKCGHHPWLEHACHQDFYQKVNQFASQLAS